MSEKTLRVGMVGLGGIAVGGSMDWGHLKNIERLDGVHIAALCDLDRNKFDFVMQNRAAKVPEKYENCRYFSDWQEMADEANLDAVWICLPPFAHGSLAAGKDVECRFAEGGTHLFIEKPISLSLADAEAVAEKLEEYKDLVVSVGYMFRYSKAIAKLKTILAEHAANGYPIAMFLARYFCAYPGIVKAWWWDKAQSGGEIVEQATHLCDLARFVIGEVDEVLAMTVNPPIAKTAVDLSRIDSPTNLVTSAALRFVSGVLGSLNCGVLMHKKYQTEVEVICDGLRIQLIDPYGERRVLRCSDSIEAEYVFTEEDDDYYFAEDAAFIKAVRTGDKTLILSPYRDAIKTLALTLRITRTAH